MRYLSIFHNMRLSQWRLTCRNWVMMWSSVHFILWSGSRTDTVEACVTLDELSEDNSRSWLKLKVYTDSISNDDLQFLLSSNDRSLWDLMNNVTFQAIEAIAKEPQNIKFWSKDCQCWIQEQLRKRMHRSSMLVHEASFTLMSDNNCSEALNKHFNMHGCDNVIGFLLNRCQKDAESFL